MFWGCTPENPNGSDGDVGFLLSCNDLGLRLFRRELAIIRLYGEIIPFAFILMIFSVFAHDYFIFISNFTNKTQRYRSLKYSFSTFISIAIFQLAVIVYRTS